VVGVCDVPAISTVCDTAGEAAATLVAAPFDWLASAIGGAAAWMFEGVWAIFDSTTRVDVTSPGYLAVYNILFGVAVFIMLIFFCLQLITGLVRRDPAALSKAALGLAKSVLGSFLVITLTATLLEVTDQLTVGIVQATGTTMEQMGGRIAALAAGLGAINIAAPGAGAIVTIFLGGLAISAAALVWFTLLIRKALLLVAIVMAPIALAGASWEATRGWVGKWASFVLALIVSKLVIVVVFLVATAQVSAPIDLDLASITDPIAGIVLMFIAAFAPYMAYKFISFAGFDMYHSMSAEQEAKSALNRPVPLSTAPKTNGATKILDGGATGGGRSGGGGASNGRPGQPGATQPGGPGNSPTTGTAGATAAGAHRSGGATGAGGAAGPGAGAVAVAGAAVAAATAGPKLGGKLGATAEDHTEASQHAGESSPMPPTRSSNSPQPVPGTPRQQHPPLAALPTSPPVDGQPRVGPRNSAGSKPGS
jgi:type IV secretion system protein TrbL